MSGREKEAKRRPWITFSAVCCSSNAFVHWFRRHSCVIPLFGTHPKMVLIIFLSLSLQCLWQVFYSRLYLVASRCQLTFKPEPSRSLTSARCLRDEHICFFWFHTYVDLGSQSFLLSIFHYRFHSLATGWPITSTLAWFTPISWPF